MLMRWMTSASVAEPVDPILLARRLLYGAPETRQRIAQELLRTEDEYLLDLLTSTVRSTESWQLRARCLEVLGLAAGGAPQGLAEQILSALTAAASVRSEPGAERGQTV
jgi:hypothetical protein